jgi:hypothetical protein
MYTRRFFIISLFVPLVFLLFGALVAIAVTPEMPKHLGVILVPYISFFLFFVLWVPRHKPKDVRYAAYRAPLVFLVFQNLYLVLEYSLGASLAKDIVGLGGVVIIISTYTILLGYLYAFLMEQGYFSYLYYMRHHHLSHNKSKKRVKTRME